MEYCTSCGAEAPDGTGYCPKCGAEITSAASRNAELRKRYEIRQGGWKKYQSPEHRLLGSVVSGLSILLLGALLFVAALHASPLVTWSNFFAWFLVGHGILLVMKFFAHGLLPEQVVPHYGNLIGGAIIAAIGALCFIGFGNYFVPMAIVSIGIYAISLGILKFYKGNGHSA
jgi:predicted RNA-binding Zn-ribbon protein involved in translation (DUF1610 family)